MIANRRCMNPNPATSRIGREAARATEIQTTPRPNARPLYESLETAYDDLIALSTYDSDWPDIVTVRDSLEPFWVAFSQPNVLGISTARLRGLFADPRWDDFEQKFARVRRILEYFGELGPIHAAMPRRFAQQMILGLAQSSESDFKPGGRYPQGFFPHTQDILHRAAARSTYAHPSLNFFNSNSSELQNRESEACRLEANGTDPEATREAGARAVADVRSVC